MVPFVQQPLGYVHRGYAGFFLQVFQCDDKFMAGSAVRIGDLETCLAQFRHQVIGIKRSELSHPMHAFRPEQTHVDIGPEQYARVTHVRRKSADGLRYLLFREPAIKSISSSATIGTGMNGNSRGATPTGAEPGPPPPWGVEKVLCRLM